MGELWMVPPAVLVFLKSQGEPTKKTRLMWNKMVTGPLFQVMGPPVKSDFLVLSGNGIIKFIQGKDLFVSVPKQNFFMAEKTKHKMTDGDKIIPRIMICWRNLGHSYKPTQIRFRYLTFLVLSFPTYKSLSNSGIHSNSKIFCASINFNLGRIGLWPPDTIYFGSFANRRII